MKMNQLRSQVLKEQQHSLAEREYLKKVERDQGKLLSDQ